MRPVDFRRRRLLQALPCALLAACAPSPAPAVPAFSARFRVAGVGDIALHVLDAENFSFVPALGWGSTCVIDGRIHLLIAPSLAGGGRTRVLWAGSLLPAADPTSAALPTPEPLPDTARREWALQVPVRTLELREDAGEPLRLTVAALTALARIQHIAQTRLRPGMDMALCGDGVNRLLAAWAAPATARGWAVLASAGGAQGGLTTRLIGPLTALAERPQLPAGVAVEDVRLPR